MFPRPDGQGETEVPPSGEMRKRDRGGQGHISQTRNDLSRLRQFQRHSPLHGGGTIQKQMHLKILFFNEELHHQRAPCRAKAFQSM